MALDVFFEVVVPLLEMETTALIAISTVSTNQTKIKINKAEN